MNNYQEWLTQTLAREKAVAGSVHLCDGSQLSLAAAHQLPPPVLAAIQRIPQGKGMAGQAWLRGKPVQVCNLQDDESGVVRPGAKAVQAQAAIAIPLFDSQQRVRAVVGLAWADERELDEEALARSVADLP